MARSPAIPNQRFGLASSIMPLAGPTPGEHTHAEIELNLVIGGSLRYLFAGQAVEFPEGRWLAYWAALPHRVLGMDRPCHLAWITVPIATLLGWDEPDLARRLLRGEVVAEPAARPGAADHARGIDAALRGDARSRRIAGLEIEAVARRIALDPRPLAAPLGRARRVARGDGPTALIERMAAWLAQRYRDDVDVAACAAAVGVHPGYAMTVFRRATGSTIRQYRERLRLAHAQRLLLTSDRDVLGVALDAGFGSLARFYVAFRRATGATPAAWRKARAG